MTCVLDSPVVITGDDLEVGVITADCSGGVYDLRFPAIVNSTDDDNEDDEELDIEEFDDDDFDDEFDDDFEDEDEGEYDVVEEFEDDFTFVDPTTKKPVTHSTDIEVDKETDDSENKNDDAEKSPAETEGGDDADGGDDAGEENADDE